MRSICSTRRRKSTEKIMSNRLFIAIPLPEPVKDFIEESASLPSNYKKTKRENLHITLQFLGDVEDERVEEIKEALNSSLQGLESFSLSIDRSGCFMRDRVPSLIYYTGSSGVGQLKNLAYRLNDSLAPLGYGEDRPFKYHITVGRLKYKRGHYKLPELEGKITFKVDKVNLYSSELRSEGPIYTIITSKSLI